MIYKRVCLFISNFRRYFPSSGQRKLLAKTNGCSFVLFCLFVACGQSSLCLCTERERQFNLMAVLIYIVLILFSAFYTPSLELPVLAKHTWTKKCLREKLKEIVGKHIYLSFWLFPPSHGCYMVRLTVLKVVAFLLQKQTVRITKP